MPSLKIKCKTQLSKKISIRQASNQKLDNRTSSASHPEFVENCKSRGIGRNPDMSGGKYRKVIRRYSNLHSFN